MKPYIQYTYEVDDILSSVKYYSKRKEALNDFREFEWVNIVSSRRTRITHIEGTKFNKLSFDSSLIIFGGMR